MIDIGLLVLIAAPLTTGALALTAWVGFRAGTRAARADSYGVGWADGYDAGYLDGKNKRARQRESPRRYPSAAV